MKKEKKERKKDILLILDSNAIIHRAYHALPPLTTKKGELVNAVYGYLLTLLNVIEKFKPTYLVASFDLAGPTFRHKEYKEYKATRVKAPDELYEQIDKVKNVLKAFQIPIFEKQGFEADDVIGTIAKKITQKNKNIEVIIVTGDLDALQLVDDNIKVYTMSRGISQAVLYNKEKVRERYSLEPDQLKDYKGLRGDASDNIPGVKGVGEKTAIKLLKEFGSLENVFAHLNEIKGSLKEKLEKDKAQALLSKQLGIIKTNLKLKIELKKLLWKKDFDKNKIIKIFQELNFFSLLKRLNNFLPDKNKNSLNLDTENNPSIVSDFKYKILKDENDFKKFTQELNLQKEVAIFQKDNYWAFSWKTGRATIFKDSLLKNEKNSEENFKKWLANSENKKISFDFKKLYKKIKRENKIILKGIYFDLEIAYYLLHSGKKIEWERIVLEELGEEILEEKGQLGFNFENNIKNKEEKIAQKVINYWKLKKILSKELNSIKSNQKNKLEKLFYNLEIPLISVLAEMELKGIKTNPLVLKGINAKISQKIEKLKTQIYQLAGEKFNLNSPQQLRVILFEKLKLATDDIKKTKTGFSTAISELSKLKGKHKIIEKIETYRELFKLKTTYLDTLPELIEKDGRIHTTFKQTTTATGRLASENPNLQNIPIKTALGKMIRTAFVAEKNYKLVSLDYSQIELRVAAHLSGDKKLIQFFQEGKDIHQATAAEVHHISLSQVTQAMRRSAKALNFGIIYGMSTYGFAQSANISQEEAQKFIQEYMKKFPQVAQMIKEIKEEARKNGYVETETGRRRYVPEINSPNFQVRSSAERMAVNMPLQGLAADIMKIAMLQVDNYLKNISSANIILQIHDELIIEIKENLIEKNIPKIKKIMENAYQLKVPLIVDVSQGDNWGEL